MFRVLVFGLRASETRCQHLRCFGQVALQPVLCVSKRIISDKAPVAAAAAAAFKGVWYNDCA